MDVIYNYLDAGRGLNALNDYLEEVRRLPGASRRCENRLCQCGLRGAPVGQERRSLARGGFTLKIYRRWLFRAERIARHATRWNTVKEAVKVD